MDATSSPDDTPAETEAERRRLAEYDRKRAFDRTPEPRGETRGEPDSNRFVVQEHHARRLHWDLRLEHDGVLVSWALPRGFPDTPAENRLAVHTEDHPLEYLTFSGGIPSGEYGGGDMWIWDTGTFTAKEFTDRKVVVELRGERVRGRYALFATDEKNWLIHRMDPVDPDVEPLPRDLAPMKAVLSTLPERPDVWGYEVKWDGVRAIAYGEPGRLRLINRNGRDATSQYPEIATLARQIGARRMVLDGELVAFAENGLPSFERLQSRMHLASEAQARRRSREVPVTYVIFDLLYLDGRLLLDRPYEERRAELDALGLSGPHWQTPESHRGDGAVLLEATRAQGLEGIVAKRLASTYQPGRRSADWLKIKNVRTQDVLIGGWVAGQGRRSGGIGALIIGFYEYDEQGAHLRFAGKVGTGFDAAELARLKQRLAPLERTDSPFEGRQPQQDTVFVDPELVCEVAFAEWTSTGTLRHPSYQRLRDDKPPTEVVREDVTVVEPADAVGTDGGDGAEPARHIEVDGVAIMVPEPGRLVFPMAGTTVGDVIDYYRAAGSALLDHVAGRRTTQWQYPDGVTGQRVEDTAVVDDLPELIGAVARHAVEFHPDLALRADPDRPTMLAFGIGMASGAGPADCAGVALWIREIFDSLGLDCLAISAGSAGLQLRVPLNAEADFTRTEPLAHAVAALVERQHPDRVATRTVRRRRSGPAVIDWRQQDGESVRAAPFSLYAKGRPVVAAPLRWDEVEEAAASAPAAEEILNPAPERIITELVERRALCVPLLELSQELPTLA